ncbi:MAG: hypothetical protein QM773_01060 [Hyphomonadaceae bacterium]
MLALKTFDQKPYEMEIAAKPLATNTLTAGASVIGPLPAAKATGGEAERQPSSDDLDAPQLASERTDLRGRGDGLMVDDRVVVTGYKEGAHRAPDYSREQVAAMVCARRSEGNAGRLKSAQQAYAATVAAYDVRAAYLAGKRTGKEVDAAERKRQDAVKSMNSSLFAGMFGERSKKADLPKPERDGIVLENPDLYTFTENGRAVMAVYGEVRNTTLTRIELPPVTLVAIDGWDFILAAQTLLLPFDALEPGETRSFDIRFLNPPDTTYEVYVHFAPPFEYRLRRECDPADTAPDKAAIAPRSAADAARVTSALHTASELNLLTDVYRKEAEAAWGLRACGNPGEDPADDPNKPRNAFQIVPGGGGERRSFGISLNLDKFNREGLCAAWSRRPPWRESFALGEASDEAWGALLAKEEATRRLKSGQGAQSEVDEADSAFTRAYATFRTLGAKALARAGKGIPDVEVAVSASTFGYDQLSKAFDGADISSVGFFVDIEGTVQNTAGTARTVGALVLALVDRLEQPLLTFRLEEGFELAPGESRKFQQRVYFSDPVRRRDSKDAPPWEIRVGVVGR